MDGFEFTKDGTVDLRGRPARRSTTGQWRASCFVLANQALASVTYYGVYNNLVRYLTNEYHQGNVSSANNVNYWVGTTSITALVGGFISDSYLGRFWTSMVFLVIYLLSMVMLTLSAIIPSLRPPNCSSHGPDCKKATPRQAGYLYLSLYLNALASGAYQPCNSSLGADQFDEENPEELPKKTVYFNFFYLSMTVGSLTASTLILFVQENVSWGWGFAICTATLALSMFIYLCGTPFYRNHKPGGNPLTRLLQVLVAAFRKFRVKVPDASSLYEDEGINQIGRRILHTPKLRFLDKAAVITNDLSKDRNLWKLCTVTQVEEVKCVVRMIPIFISGIMYSVVYSQMATFFLEQGGTMNTRLTSNFNIPPGSLSIFESLSIIFWTVAYGRLLVPVLRRLTKNPKGLTELQRTGTGLLVIMMSMIVGALVENRRLQVAADHNMLDSDEALPMSVFWLVPQYWLVGASEVFTFIGLMEFFYNQSPDALRAIGSSLQLMAVALGNYSSSLVVNIVTKATGSGGRRSWISNNLNRSHLDYYYWTLAVATALNFLLFLFCARSYRNITTVAIQRQPA